MQQLQTLPLETGFGYVSAAGLHDANCKWELILGDGGNPQVPSSKGAQAKVWYNKALQEQVCSTKHLWIVCTLMEKVEEWPQAEQSAI